MKKAILSVAVLLIGTTALLAQDKKKTDNIYIADSCKISFFSETPVENIDATNKAAKPILNTATGDIQVKIVNTAFVFPKPLMQEHFNENYMESEKYPNTVFKGKINEKIDYTKDGVNNVTVTGKLDMHGVTKEITIKGTVTVKGAVLLLNTSFMIHIADYNIKIPSLVVKNIAEDVTVKLNATMKPYVKK